MRYILCFLLATFLLVQSCESDSKLESEIAKIEMDVKVERFDRFFAEASPNDLPQLKASYPFMFSSQYPDSLWIAKMSDTLQQQLFA